MDEEALDDVLSRIEGTELEASAPVLLGVDRRVDERTISLEGPQRVSSVWWLESEGSSLVDDLR